MIQQGITFRRSRSSACLDDYHFRIAVRPIRMMGGGTCALGQGCVKTSTSRERAELFSLFAFLDGARQRCSFLIQLIRGKRSTRKSDFGVFTQPGSDSDLSTFTDQVCFAPMNGRRETR